MNKIFSLLVVMLMSLAANAEKTITWDYNTIKGINYNNPFYLSYSEYPVISKDGITLSVSTFYHDFYFKDCNWGFGSSLFFEEGNFTFFSTIGRITSITISCTDENVAIYDNSGRNIGWTATPYSASWADEPSYEVDLWMINHMEIKGIQQITFTVDGKVSNKYRIYGLDALRYSYQGDYVIEDVEAGSKLVFKPDLDHDWSGIPKGKKIKSIKVVDLTWDKTTYLTDNGDGTWTLPSMPAYNVMIMEELEPDPGNYTISNIPAGWWVNYTSTVINGTYEVAEGEEVIFIPANKPANVPAGKRIKSVKVVDYMYENATYLTDNGDGTWTLAAMPGYNVIMVVEYEAEVYTEFVEETGTLTYYYDTQREERTGITELYDPVNNPDAVRFTGYYKKVTKAVIDPSMKNAPLTSTRSMFNGGVNPSPLVIYNLSNMTDIEGLENLNTVNVTDMCDMFSLCSSLKWLDLSTFNTSKVTNMYSMFMACSELQMVDVSSFDISKVTKMGLMFGGCPKLETICCSNDWSNTSADSYVMFSGNYKLVGGKGTPFDSNVIDATYARPDGGPSKPGYFTEKPSLQGDLNSDGKVDIADAVTVLNIMASGEYNADADLNGDKKVDIADFVTILNIMAAQ